MDGRKLGSTIAVTLVSLLAAVAQAQTQPQTATPPPESSPAPPPPVEPAAPAPQAPPATGTTDAPAAAPEPTPTPDFVPPPPAAVIHTPAMQARWETSLYGFAELDLMQDTTQSFGAASNNTMLARAGTYAGTHPREQFTANNSQLGLRIGAPAYRDLRASGQVEMDFFGVLPADATEQAIYTLGAIRMRLFYLKLETPIFDLLAGQTYDLFAWGGAGFNPASVAFLGLAGQIYHRQPQVRLSKSVSNAFGAIDLAVAAVRPVQRDSGVPDLEAGIRLAATRWNGVTTQGFGQPALAPLALGLSAVGRRFAVAEFLPNPGEPKVAFGGGLAANLVLPVVTAKSVAARGNALTVTGELSIGTGISDLYTGLTGGALFPTLPNPGALVPPPLYRPNIDPGIVTFDGNGNLKTINWWAVLVGVQYYLPVDDGRIWLSANFSRLESTNLASLTPEASRGGIFIQQDYFDANVFDALTPAVQLGISVQGTRQTFGDMPFGGTVVPESRNLRVEGAFRLFF